MGQFGVVDIHLKVLELDIEENEKVGTLCLLSSPICPPPALPSQFLWCLCFGSPPHTSSVFVSHCINSVMVMSGMCINSDLPYPCLPPFPCSLYLHLPLTFSFIPARLCPHAPPSPPPAPPCPFPPMTLNLRMAPITRTCWCVRVPWEWPPVSLPQWEASPAPTPLTSSGAGLWSALPS